MPWYVPWSENIKKRACRYLLQRYLGQFLEEKLTLDQLSVDLYNGTGTVSNVTLDCEALNELGEAQGWPLEFVDGFVQEMNVSIPWTTLLTDDSFVQVNGLSITIQPKQRSESATSMLESMWSSMTSSMQLAAECLKQEGESPAAPQPVEGIELFAQTIDSILCRVKVRFSNTTIRMEHVPKDSSTGVALEIQIKNIDYLDEAGSDPPTEIVEAEKNMTYVVSTFTTKRITFEGVTFHTDEFPSKARTFARSVLLSESTWKAGNNQTPEESDPNTESKYISNDGSLYLSSETNPFISKQPSPDRSLLNISEMPDPILFGRLAGRQEMRLKMKQSEEAQGPRVDFQLTLGSLTMFLSPRQFHILAELANGLAEPHLEDTSNVPIRGHPGMESKPMQRMDFERVEAQLMGGMASERLPPNLMAKHGWSTAHIDDSDTEDDKFLPLASKRDDCQMADSFASSGSMSSSITSNASSLPSLMNTPKHRSGSPYNTRRKRTIPQVEGDPYAEVSQLHIRIASFACVLLHEDILTLSASLDGDCLAASSVKQMKSISEAFFDRVGLFAISGYGGRDFEVASQAFDAAVTYNHLRLIAAPLVLEGSEKTNSQGSSLSVQLTMARVDLRECLRTAKPEDPTQTVSEAIPLLIFTREEEKSSKDYENMASYMSNPLSKSPDVKISFRNTQKAMKIGGEKKYAYPRTEIITSMEPCTVEVDISIVDRVCALLNPQPLCGKPGGLRGTPTTIKSNYFSDRDNALSDHYCELKFSCPLMRIKLRFPLADLRPAHDMSRCPWWKRSIRPDFLVGNLQQASVTSISKTSSKETASVKVQCRKFDLYYVESDGDNEIHIGCASADDGGVTSEFPSSSTDWPSVSITVLPTPTAPSGLLDSSSDGEGDGMNLRYKAGKTNLMGQSTAMLMDRLKSPNGGCPDGRPGPFSSKKMVHESDTPHAKNDEDDADELVIPGDSAEMAEFVEVSVKNSLLQIQCNLPVVSLQLGSKHLYEILYNRINSDLLLWEPSAPKSVHHSVIAGNLDPTSFLAGFDMHDSIYPAFSMCKSGINYNSDSESSSSSTDSNVYYSVYDQRARQSCRSKILQKSINRKERAGRMNNICFHLQIKKGLLTTYTPVRDSLNHVLPVQQGELVVLVSDLAVCHVGGVGGDRRSALVSVQSSSAQLYHCGLIPSPTEKMPLRLYGCSLPGHLKKTIYPSGNGVSVKDNPTGNDRDFLSVAVSVKPNKDYPNFKTIRVAAGISNATLRHYLTISQHSWLNQFMDVFDVLDYPVPGYEPSTVVTELHVHLWDCAVDYRPIHLPLSTILTMGSFSVSSNVIAQTNASNLRFIAEECALFLSDEVSVDSQIAVNLKRDYVCVIDLGLFELSLRLNDKNVTTAPRVDLRASNNAVHIRTCSDSFAALCRLVDYLASDGDLSGSLGQDAGAECGHQINSQANSAERDNTASGDEDLLIGVVDRPPEEIRDLSQSQVQQVNDLMAEAMKESLNSDDMNPDEKNQGIGEGVEIFFFPDESKALKSLKSTPKNSSATDILGNINQERASSVKDTSEKSDEMINEFSNAEGHYNPLTPEGDSLPPMAVVTKELGDFSIRSDITEVGSGRNQPKASDIGAFKTKQGQKPSSSENTDDEFCIIPRHEEMQTSDPEIKWLIDESVEVIENHFTIPIGKTDLLKPPKNFPMAVLRYTLCEMTLIWHMYGGHDFKQSAAGNDGTSPSGGTHSGRSSSLGPNRKTVTIDDSNEKHSPTVIRRECDPYKILPKSSSAPSTHYGQYQLGVRYSKGSEGVALAAPRTPGSPQQPRWMQRGGPARRHDVLIELQLNKVQFQHETYPSGGTQASRQVLIVSKIEIRDRLASSLINKFLHQYTSEQKPMRKHANMLVIKAVHLRPDCRLLLQECCLKVSLLPLRFNIDQDSLLFLVSFFGNIGEGDLAKDGGISSVNSGSNQSLHSLGGGSSRHSTPTHQPPVMSVNQPRTTKRNTSQTENVMISSDCLSEDSLSLRDNDDENEGPMLNSYEAEQMVSENLIRLEEDCVSRGSGTGPSESRSRGSISSSGGEAPPPNSQTAVNDAPIYFRSVVFSPEVPIRLDYHGKRVDLSHGPLAGLLMGLGQLNCSELRLKSLSYRHGLLGVERLLKWALQEWLGDIKRHQLPGLLGGVGPMYSLVQLFQGIRDLFWLPIEQYQRDGRLVRGLQRGASSFTTSTAMAALDITARIIHLIQATAETAYDMVSPSPGLRGARGKGRRRRERPRQPHDIREGVTNAYHLVKDGLGETAQALASVAVAERSARGYSGAVGGVLRQLPPTAIAPFLLASAAASRVLGGVRATLAPHHHRDHRDKWRATPGDDDEEEETRRWDGER